jgi:DNA polymerase III subunit delta'
MLVGPDANLPLPWLLEPLTQGLALRGHALLLHGGEGRGLMELAMTMAQALLCSHPSNDKHRGAGSVVGVPCGTCGECHLVQLHTHPDLHLLMPAALRETVGWRADADDDTRDRSTKPSQDIRVDEVRAAIDWGTRSVARARVKVLVVHPATSMNNTTANALLKTLEEPPGSLRILLTARSPTELLPTIASRCQHLRVAAPLSDQAVAWLQVQGVADAATLLQAAGGEPLTARDMAAAGIDAESWARIPAAVWRGDAGVFAGWSVALCVDALTKLCHDLMCVAAGGTPRYFSAAMLKPANPAKAAGAAMSPARSGSAAAARPSPPSPSWEALRRWSIELLQMSRHADHPWQAPLAVDAMVSRGSRVWREALANEA